MKNKYLGILSLVAILSLSGCGGPSPRALNGKYYWMGDSNCKRYRILSENSIMCFNSDGKEVGYRNAMSDQELQMYRFNQAREDASLEQLNYSNQQQANRNLYQSYKLMGY